MSDIENIEEVEKEVVIPEFYRDLKEDPEWTLTGKTCSQTWVTA